MDKTGQAMAATSDGLFSWDGNETWSLVPGFPEVNTTAIAIDNRPTLPVYYIGTEEQGVFVSEDGGSTWNSFNEGLKKSNISRLKLTDSNPRKLYAGTEDGGVWVTTLKKEVTAVLTFQKPEITLSIFPNPNSGSFSIITNSDAELRGRLKLLNLLGEVVYASDNIKVGPNNLHEVSVGNITPGNYILVFTNDRFTTNIKVIITNSQ